MKSRWRIPNGVSRGVVSTVVDDTPLPDGNVANPVAG